MFPDQIRKFVDVFAKLPSIGPRQATRLAFYLISRGNSRLEEMANAVKDLESIKLCSDCFFIHSNLGQLCNICADKNRNKKIIMILEKETDLISMERTKKYSGRYLVLGELTKSGVLESPQKIRLEKLKQFITVNLEGQADEIIIATNPTTYGDLNAMVIKKELDNFTQKFTRLGRGIPTGGEIEFADEETLSQALERRI